MLICAGVPVMLISRRALPQLLMFNRIMAAFASPKSTMPTASQALKGRSEALSVSEKHVVNKNRAVPPFPDNTKMALFGFGCFWGAERKFWVVKGVYSTQVGYSAGFTENPTYREVCSGQTGHNEVVRVVYDPSAVEYADLVHTFFESHNPTQGFQQGNDVGTQYRSGIYYYDDSQKAVAEATKKAYQEKLTKARKGDITTEIIPAEPFYYAEDYHQQYLHKNPGGYCGLGGTGVSCPRGIKIDKAKDEL